MSDSVIDIIAFADIDYKKIAIEFAKEYPDEFVKFYRLTHMKSESWYRAYRDLMIAGDKIQAIKLFREYTKASLYEAKRFSDYIQYLLRVNGFPMKETNYSECGDINTVADEYRHMIPFVVK